MIDSKRDEQFQGRMLSAGEVIQDDDEYKSSDGSWRKAGYAAGLTVQPGNETEWRRRITHEHAV